jgi:hypothetical protein
MKGSDIQVAFATKVQAGVVAAWLAAATRLENVGPQRIEPALTDLVADLVMFCRDVARRVQAGEDAGFILQHHYGPLAWNNAIYAGGFDKVLRQTVGKRTPWQMRALLVEAMSGEYFRP